MMKGRTGRWGWWLRVAGAACLTLFGFDVPMFGVAMIPVSLVLIAGGTAWLVRLLVRPAPGESEAPARRKQVALSVGTSVLMLVVLLAITTTVRFRRDEDRHRPAWQGGPMASQIFDPELGWSPYGPPDVVGQRLQRVDPARPRVLLMGDSILYGPYLRDEEQVGAYLEPLLPGYQVLNASVSGYSIDQYLLMLERIVPVVKPELIVVGIFTGNDYQITSREFAFGNHKPLLRLAGDKLVRADVAGDCVDRLSRSVLMRVVWQSRELAADTIESICRPARLTRSEADRSIAAMFKAIDALAKEHGAAVLHVLLPVDSEYQTSTLDRYLYVSRHYDLWRMLVEGGHLRFDFSEDLFRGGDPHSELFMEDHAHLFPPGHELLARALHREITRRKLLPETPPPPPPPPPPPAP
ncbi:MAG: SGNH/GDSL hydrolase family protein [Polyangiaceae bacterium]